MSSGTQVKDKDGNVIGIHVIATLKKNKVGPPFKKCEFDIIFGKGIVEHEYIFDEVRSYCDKNKVTLDGNEIRISGTGAWKELVVNNAITGEVIVEKKFYKQDFGNLMNNPEYSKYVMAAIDQALTLKMGDAALLEEQEDEEIDEESED